MADFIERVCGNRVQNAGAGNGARTRDLNFGKVEHWSEHLQIRPILNSKSAQEWSRADMALDTDGPNLA
jgi:hypothetical protein